MEDGEESNWETWDQGAGRKMEEEMMCPSRNRRAAVYIYFYNLLS